MLAPLAGFEPAPPIFVGSCFIQLSYNGVFGGNGGDRTCDADIMSVVLYQLSYVTVLYLVESIGLEPIRPKSCKDFPGALPIPHIADNKKPLGFPNGIYLKIIIKSINWWSHRDSNSGRIVANDVLYQLSYDPMLFLIKSLTVLIVSGELREDVLHRYC